MAVRGGVPQFWMVLKPPKGLKNGYTARGVLLYASMYFHKAALPLHVLNGSAVGSDARYTTEPLPRRAPTSSGTPASSATTVPFTTLPAETSHGPWPLNGCWAKSARDCI